MADKQKTINIAVIAHVDAGKSTLVDALLAQSQVFRDNEQVVDCVMDSDAIERERGITIYSKNCSIMYKDYKINIVDTPGHADFSSEVERIMKTVDTVILLVDSSEGPMPQTRFVLSKSLAQGINPILFINKIDKKDARIDEVVDEVYELFMDLEASDEQLDFPILYGIARQGIAVNDPAEVEQISIGEGEQKIKKSPKGYGGLDIEPLLECITKHCDPYPDLDDEPLQLQVSTLAYDDYIGRLGIGRVTRGRIKEAQMVAVTKEDGSVSKNKINQIFVYKGLSRVAVPEASSGDIVVVSGISDISIGETICNPDHPESLGEISIEEPTLSMNFMVNSSPEAGKSGKYVTSRHIRERLNKELEVNVGLLVEETDSTDSFKVSGRGELHLSILIENMRREGFEFAVSKAEVIYKYDERNKKQEPMEIAYVDVPDEFSGAVIQKLSGRKGELVGMTPIHGGYTRLEFNIPSRGLIGYRGEFMTDTKGNGILNTEFEGYGPYKGDMFYRKTGSLIAYESGEAITYGLFNAQERGPLFIGPGTKVYAGMVIGQSGKSEDVEVNVCKTKKLTNTRSSSADEALKLVPPKIMSLEQCLEFIDTDELLEVTPENLRIRKKILDPMLRKRDMIRQKQLAANAAQG